MESMILNSPEGFDFGVLDLMSEIVTGSICGVVALGAFDHFLLSSLNVNIANQLLIDIIPTVHLELKFEPELSSDTATLGTHQDIMI